MKDIGMLFSADMVRAILAGTKTQTRRVIKPPSGMRAADGFVLDTGNVRFVGNTIRRPPIAVGDRIYVRETWGVSNDKYHRCCYFVDSQYPQGRSKDQLVGGRWHPSIHMPRAAARIWLEVVNVRAERLQDISADDAKTEGIAAITKDGEKYKGWEWQDFQNTEKEAFAKLWEKINGSGSWNENPFVWAIGFKKIEVA